MNELAVLITSIGAAIGTAGGGIAMVITAVRSSRKERATAAHTMVRKLARALQDGELSSDELADLASGGDDDEGSDK